MRKNLYYIIYIIYIVLQIKYVNYIYTNKFSEYISIKKKLFKGICSNPFLMIENSFALWN